MKHNSNSMTTRVDDSTRGPIYIGGKHDNGSMYIGDSPDADSMYIGDNSESSSTLISNGDERLKILSEHLLTSGSCSTPNTSNEKIYHFILGLINSQKLTLNTGGIDGDLTRLLIDIINSQKPNLVGSWYLHEIGSSTIARDHESDNGQITIKSFGTTFAGASDNFAYRAIPFIGNITMTIQALRMDDVNPDAIAGIQIRQTLDETSPYAMIGWTPQKYASFLHRDEPNHHTTSTKVANSVSVAPHLWLRLSRIGDLFISEISRDANKFELIEQTIIRMPEQVYIGLAVTSSGNKPTTAVFDQLYFGMQMPS